MKTASFNALIFVGLAVWAAIAHPWAAPGFAGIAISRLLLVALRAGSVRIRHLEAAVVLSLFLSFLGVTYLVSLFVGLPDTGRFWVVFGACTAILFPVVALARQSLFRGPPESQQRG